MISNWQLSVVGVSPSDLASDSLSNTLSGTDAYLLRLLFERLRLKGAEAVARTCDMAPPSELCQSDSY